MPVTEVAQLSLRDGVKVLSPALLSNLAKAKASMEDASGSKFWYYHFLEDEKCYLYCWVVAFSRVPHARIHS